MPRGEENIDVQSTLKFCWKYAWVSPKRKTTLDVWCHQQPRKYTGKLYELLGVNLTLKAWSRIWHVTHDLIAARGYICFKSFQNSLMHRRLIIYKPYTNYNYWYSGRLYEVYMWPWPSIRGWSGVANVSCILRHRGVQMRLAFSWARPAILVAGKGRGGMF